jgi:cysteinyl-tRNA synthetase
MKIYNTLSAKKEGFAPRGEEVTMYVCGINPYSDSHIGHAMSYIIFDVVRRYLEFRGYKVKHVENVTDVEDNIIAHANRQGISVKELTDKFTVRYFEDMDALNILRPHETPKATETIPEIIGTIHGLVEKGFAYAVGGDVYFRVRNMPDYGKLSHRTLDSMMAGARIEPGDAKEHPMDFVLWKAAKPGEPAWDSPWGKGRPGWHIECSAMSVKFLGEQIDIHGGGQDLIFPHHENEIAQSECYTGKKPFVQYWMHNGLLQLGAEKMSKSLGNLITIREALQKYTADAIRIFILSSYYRSPLTYSEEALEAAERGADRLRQVVWGEKPAKPGTGNVDAGPYRQRFIEAMDDDFNTSQALATLFDLTREINRADEAGMDARDARETLRELGGVLGLTFKVPDKTPLDAEILAEMSKLMIEKIRREKLQHVLQKVTSNPDSGNIEGYLNLLRELRNALREDKKFQLADEIRNRLNEVGIIFEDTPQGTVWKRKR